MLLIISPFKDSSLFILIFNWFLILGDIISFTPLREMLHKWLDSTSNQEDVVEAFIEEEFGHWDAVAFVLVVDDDLFMFLVFLGEG